MDIHNILLAAKKAQGDWYNAIFDSGCLFVYQHISAASIRDKFTAKLIDIITDPIAIGHGIIGLALFIGVIARSGTAVLKFYYTLKNKTADGD